MKDKFRKNIKKIKKKNDLPVLESDQDFLQEFLKEKREKSSGSGSGQFRKNKHGLPFIESYEAQFDSVPDQDPDAPDGVGEPDRAGPMELEEDFSRLLDESFKEKKTSPPRPKPMPLKRRLKRYPLPETELDLHGFTALGAELKAKSFITSAKLQGFFTLRIIVGRGLHSQEGPVLPDVIEDLLKTLKKENLVLAYEWEGKKKGKSGAVIVYLKQFNH